MHSKIVETLKEALIVRHLRNSCREYLTNYRKHIGLVRQIGWYFLYYRRARPSAACRLYLFYNEADCPVGYGALHERESKLYVTECVAKEYQEQGFGKIILAAMMALAREEKRELAAEIWTNNIRSIALHEKAGFTLESSRIKEGRELCCYLLKLPI